MATTDQRSYHHGDLAPALLRAVEEIVGERGAAALSLREAARRAGVSHSAPAHHFGDKEGLLDAFAQEGFEMLGEAMAKAVASLADPEDTFELLDALGRTYLHFALDHPAHYEVMFATAPHPDREVPTGREVAADASFGPLALSVGKLVQDGVVPAEDGRYVATMLWAVCHGVATLWNDGKLGHFYEDQDADEVADGVMRAMRRLLEGRANGGPPPPRP